MFELVEPTQVDGVEPSEAAVETSSAAPCAGNNSDNHRVNAVHRCICQSGSVQNKDVAGSCQQQPAIFFRQDIAALNNNRLREAMLCRDFNAAQQLGLGWIGNLDHVQP